RIELLGEVVQTRAPRHGFETIGIAVAQPDRPEVDVQRVGDGSQDTPQHRIDIEYRGQRPARLTDCLSVVVAVAGKQEVHASLHAVSQWVEQTDNDEHEHQLRQTTAAPGEGQLQYADTAKIDHGDQRAQYGPRHGAPNDGIDLEEVVLDD